MNKSQKLSLNDYIDSKSDISLELFIHSINPFFKLTKKANLMLLELISKYEKDHSSTRLDQIENFIAPNSSDKKILVKKAKETKNIAKVDPKYFELKELEEKLTDAVRSRDAAPQKELFKRIKELKRELGERIVNLETEYAKVTTESDIERKESIVRACLGDWNQEGTVGWAILNTTQDYFQILNNPHMNNSTFLDAQKADNGKPDPNMILKLFEEVIGKKIRPLTCNFDKYSGTLIISNRTINFMPSFKNDRGTVLDYGIISKLNSAPRELNILNATNR